MNVSLHRRPRVAGDREEEILTAALELLVETGYDRLTMDAIAARAKASKATLYRRWGGKAHLVMEALLAHKQEDAEVVPDTGSLRGDLIAHFCGPSGGATNLDMARVLGAVISAVMMDEEFAELFRERFIGPKITAAAEIYRRAGERGELRAAIDYELIGPALPAVAMHRFLILGKPVDEAIVARIVDSLILPAVLAQPEKDQ